MNKVNIYNVGLFSLCLIGFGLSYYSQYVKIEKQRNAGYQAMCDINEQINCSKVLTSEYSYGFGLVAPYLGKDHALNLPNHILGMIGYPILGFLSLINNSFVTLLVILISLSSNCLSAYLAYLLFSSSKDCVPCLHFNLLCEPLQFHFCFAEVQKPWISEEEKGWKEPTERRKAEEEPRKERECK